MPSPIGHALAGIATGCLVMGRRSAKAPVERGTRPGLATFIHSLRERWMSREVLGFGLLGMLPDIDFLFGSHSTYTHSVGAVVTVGILAGILMATTGHVPRPRHVVAVAGAYGSHVLLDWLGSDDTAPLGVMALWPFSDQFFLSDHRWFPSVCREVWELRCWLHNAQGVTWEIAVLAPLAVGASYLTCVMYRR